MHKIELKPEVFLTLKKHCLQTFQSKTIMPVDKLMEQMMDYKEIPMHFPYHHFILPAALLTLTAMEKGLSENDLSIMLECAATRSQNVLGGFCGNYGACGAAVGAGIFMSIYTDTSPLSETSWQWSN